MVGVPTREHFIDNRAIAIHPLHLEERSFVVIETEPGHRIENRLHRRGCRTLDVGVLDPQDERALMTTRKSPGEKRGARAAEMKKTRGAGRETRTNRHGTSERAPRGCDGRVSGWDTRSSERSVPSVHERSCAKVDRPKRGRPFGLRQNAAPASPHSSAIG